MRPPAAFCGAALTKAIAAGATSAILASARPLPRSRGWSSLATSKACCGPTTAKLAAYSGRATPRGRFGRSTAPRKEAPSAAPARQSPGAFYIMDRAYIDFERLFLLHGLGAFFVVRAKSNTQYRRRYSRAVDKSKGVRCDQTSAATPRRVLRCDDGQGIRFPDEQPRRSAGDRRQPVPPQVAGGVVFHMDRAASADQVLFRHLGERGKDPNMDRRGGLRAGGYRPEAAQHLDRPLHNFSDSEPHPVRENPVISFTFDNRLRFCGRRFTKTM